MKTIRQQIKELREQIINRHIDVLVKSNKEIDLSDVSYTPYVDLGGDDLYTLDRITYHCPDGYEGIKGADNITIDISNEDENRTLTLEELEINNLLNIAEYLIDGSLV